MSIETGGKNLLACWVSFIAEAGGVSGPGAAAPARVWNPTLYRASRAVGAMPLPLADRLALFLSRSPATVAGLSQVFRTERRQVQNALSDLQDRSVVARREANGHELWHLPAGVHVSYRPGRVEVSGPMAPSAASTEPRCSATTQAGTRCKRAAGPEGTCGIHG